MNDSLPYFLIIFMLLYWNILPSSNPHRERPQKAETTGEKVTLNGQRYVKYTDAQGVRVVLYSDAPKFLTDK